MMEAAISASISYPGVSSFALVLSTLLVAMTTGNMLTRILLLFAILLVYSVFGQRARRSMMLWRKIGREMSIRGTSPDNVYSESSSRIFLAYYLNDNENPFWRATSFSDGLFKGAPVLIVPSSGKDSVFFRLPVARLVLFWIGGVMRYTRGLLIQLLRSTRKRNYIVVIMAPLPSGDRPKSVVLENKSVFAAAIKANASVTPVIVDSQKECLHVGCELDSIGERSGVPQSREIRDLVERFRLELENLYNSGDFGDPIHVEY